MRMASALMNICSSLMLTRFQVVFSARRDLTTERTENTQEFAGPAELEGGGESCPCRRPMCDGAFLSSDYLQELRVLLEQGECDVGEDGGRNSKPPERSDVGTAVQPQMLNHLHS